MTRKTIHYSGNVQGVGFRFTAQRVASKFNVTGYVRNLPDGRVELVAEGEPAEVDVFADAVAERMTGHITDAQSTEAPATGEFDNFQTRY